MAGESPAKAFKIMSDETVVRRLPLWENCLEEMEKQGIEFGKKFPMKWLVEQLGCPADTIEFGAAISNINDSIIGRGYYLSARDMNGEAYAVVSPEQAEHVADNRTRRAFRELRRSITLLGGILQNPAAMLTDEAKRRIERKEERNAVRYVLMSRTSQVQNALKKHTPSLLDNPFRSGHSNGKAGSGSAPLGAA